MHRGIQIFSNIKSVYRGWCYSALICTGDCIIKAHFKTQAQPESPKHTGKAILENPQEINPVRERILSLHNGYSITNPPHPTIWERFSPLRYSAWRLLVIQVCPLIMMTKSTTSPGGNVLCLFETRRVTTVSWLYTDGLQIENLVGCAAGLPY